MDEAVSLKRLFTETSGEAVGYFADALVSRAKYILYIIHTHMLKCTCFYLQNEIECLFEQIEHYKVNLQGLWMNCIYIRINHIFYF